MTLTDFIYESNKAEDINELIESMLHFLAQFEIDRFMLAELSHDSLSDKESNFGILTNYPEEWLKHYIDNHYVDYDPVYRKGLTAKTPWAWEEIMREKISKKSKRVMEEAGDFKLCSGAGVSIHEPYGGITGIGFASPEKNVRFGRDTLSQIYLASVQIIVVLSEMTGKESIDREILQITKREKEVLHWIAAGKTKAEIADTLVVSDSSVKRYCENIALKFKTNNLSSAVAKAIRLGIIEPY